MGKLKLKNEIKPVRLTSVLINSKLINLKLFTGIYFKKKQIKKINGSEKTMKNKLNPKL